MILLGREVENLLVINHTDVRLVKTLGKDLDCYGNKWLLWGVCVLEQIIGMRYYRTGYARRSSSSKTYFLIPIYWLWLCQIWISRYSVSMLQPKLSIYSIYSNFSFISVLSVDFLSLKMCSFEFFFFCIVN